MLIRTKAVTIRSAIGASEINPKSATVCTVRNVSSRRPSQGVGEEPSSAAGRLGWIVAEPPDCTSVASAALPSRPRCQARSSNRQPGGLSRWDPACARMVTGIAPRQESKRYRQHRPRS